MRFFILAILSIVTTISCDEPSPLCVDSVCSADCRTAGFPVSECRGNLCVCSWQDQPDADFDESPDADPETTDADDRETSPDASDTDPEIEDADPETTDADPDIRDTDPDPDDDICEPDCLGRNCGEDGCGGLCGVCPINASCNFIQNCECDLEYVFNHDATECLEVDGPCPDDLTAEGHCRDDVWVYCDPYGTTTTIDCTMRAAECLSEGGSGGCTCGSVGTDGSCTNARWVYCDSGVMRAEDCQYLTGLDTARCATANFHEGGACYCRACERYNISTDTCEDMSGECEPKLCLYHSGGYYYCE